LPLYPLFFIKTLVLQLSFSLNPILSPHHHRQHPLTPSLLAPTTSTCRPSPEPERLLLAYQPVHAQAAPRLPHLRARSQATRPEARPRPLAPDQSKSPLTRTRPAFTCAACVSFFAPSSRTPPRLQATVHLSTCIHLTGGQCLVYCFLRYFSGSVSFIFKSDNTSLGCYQY